MKTPKWFDAGTLDPDGQSTMHCIGKVLNGRTAQADAGQFYSKADRNRAVECLNALDGVDDPAAALALLSDPRTEAATDMLEALETVYGELTRSANQYPNFPAWLCVMIKVAIDKAEGRK